MPCGHSTQHSKYCQCIYMTRVCLRKLQTSYTWPTDKENGHGDTICSIQSDLLSKTIERVIQGKLLKHAESTGNVEILQSAYKVNHSTQTTLLKVRTDILNAIQNKEVTCLILLDLSAVFNTIDHHLLLNHLKYRFGVEDKALQWIQSYLGFRRQRVVITREDCPEPVYPESIPLAQGVPQGKVLGITLQLHRVLCDCNVTPMGPKYLLLSYITIY